MNTPLLAMLTIANLLLAVVLYADERPQLIFQDDFERTESVEAREDIGNGWSTNSAARAGGNKQVDLKDGAMHIYIHKSADHAVSVRHDAEFQDGTVRLRFMLEDQQDILGLNFADLKLKTVWAGHLFKVNIGIDKLTITDLKTGSMDLKIREKKIAKKLTPEIRKLLKMKQKQFPVELDAGKWYALDVNIKGHKMRVKINGSEVGSFSSEGIAHPTKRMLRLSVPREAIVDDLRIFAN